MYFCDTMSGFVDFKNTLTCRLAKNFGLVSGLLMSEMIRKWTQNEVWITSVGPRWYVGEIVTKTSHANKTSLKNWHKKHLLSIAVKVHHTKFVESYADLDFNEKSGRLTDLAKK